LRGRLALQFPDLIIDLYDILFLQEAVRRFWKINFEVSSIEEFGTYIPARQENISVE